MSDKERAWSWFFRLTEQSASNGEPVCHQGAQQCLVFPAEEMVPGYTAYYHKLPSVLEASRAEPCQQPARCVAFSLSKKP